MSDNNQDSPDLEALFESIASQTTTVSDQPIIFDNKADPAVDEVYNRLGQLTRQLHNMLQELGYDKIIVDTAQALPTVSEQLTYVTEKTEQAATRALAEVEVTMPYQDVIQKNAKLLTHRWDAAFEGVLSGEEFKQLAVETRDYLIETEFGAARTLDGLNKIMMAQEFQDLTGQVVTKVATTFRKIETELVGMLLATIPEDQREMVSNAKPELMNGPAIHAAPDVLVSQGQVDDLLESLGF